MNAQEVPQPVLVDPTTDEMKKFWRDAGRELVKKSIDSLEDVAKQIVAVAGILEGLYFHAIAYSSLQGKVSGLTLAIYLAPVILLLVSLSISLSVFLPDRNQVNMANWRDCQSKFEKISYSKLVAVRISSIFLGLAVLALAIAIWKYLTG
jgi:uncharacterized membrane protein